MRLVASGSHLESPGWPDGTESGATDNKGLVPIWLDLVVNTLSVFFPFLAGWGSVQTQTGNSNEDTSILIDSLSRMFKLL